MLAARSTGWRRRTNAPPSRRGHRNRVPLSCFRPWPTKPEDRLRRGLAQLQATEFLYETRLFRISSTLPARAHPRGGVPVCSGAPRALHARIVRAIEELYGDRLDEQVERLAHHALRGEAWEKAVPTSARRDEGDGTLGLPGGRRRASSGPSRRSRHLPESRERTRAGHRRPSRRQRRTDGGGRARRGVPTTRMRPRPSPSRSVTSGGWAGPWRTSPTAPGTRGTRTRVRDEPAVLDIAIS